MKTTVKEYREVIENSSFWNNEDYYVDEEVIKIDNNITEDFDPNAYNDIQQIEILGGSILSNSDYMMAKPWKSYFKQCLKKLEQRIIMIQTRQDGYEDALKRLKESGFKVVK